MVVDRSTQLLGFFSSFFAFFFFSLSGGRGRLGHGNDASVFVPTMVQSLANERVSNSLVLFDQAAAGMSSSAMEDMSLTSLENVSLDKSLRMSIVVQISCGAEHTICRNRGGRVYGWGENSEGQLGLGDTKDRMVPVLVASSPEMDQCRIIDIVCGTGHTMAVDDVGQLFTWGRGGSGGGSGVSGPSFFRVVVSPLRF